MPIQFIILAIFLSGPGLGQAQEVQSNVDPTFKILRFSNWFPASDEWMKWGEPVLATPAVITYAFALQRMNLHMEVGECQMVQALDGLIRDAGFSRGEFLSEVRAGVEMWNEACGARFVFIGETARADVVIGMTVEGDGSGITKARSSLTKGNARANGGVGLRKGSICLDANQSWTLFQSHRVTGNSHAMSVRLVVAHEAGHMLGLDHPADSNQLMDPLSYRREDIDGLMDGDRRGAVFLYGPPRR